jgi:hypothetical protein
MWRGLWTQKVRARRVRIAAVAITAVVATVALAPSASAKRPTPTTSSTTTSTTVPAAWDPRIQPIADQVAQLRGLAFAHPVTAVFLDDAAFEKQIVIDQALTKAERQQLARDQSTLRAFGLITPDVNLREQVESLDASGAAAYYDPKTKKITVKGTNLDDPATRATVAHELTHALQDQHFDLLKLDKAATTTTHGSSALHMLAEGDAVRIQDAYVKTMSDADQATYEARRAELGRQSLAEIAAKGISESLQFDFQAPYALGPSALEALVAKEQGTAVDGLFANPPVADAVFVSPSALVEHRTFQSVAPPALAAGEKRLGKPDMVGALTLFQLLASRIDNATALSAADAWDGDSMVMFTAKGKTCVRTTFAGRGPEGTATITNALNQWVPQMPAGAAAVSGTPDQVTLTACDAGSAVTPVANKPNASIAFVANRDGFFELFVKNGDTDQVAQCTADTIVRDPVFAPVIEAAGNDPSAEPDQALVATVGARLRAVHTQCQQT